MNITFFESAGEDLVCIQEFIAKENPVAADQVIQKIHSTIGQLETHPKIGRPGRVSKTRELIVPALPFFIVYRLRDHIEILNVIHTSRKWPE